MALAFRITDILNPVLRKMGERFERNSCTKQRETYVQGGEPASRVSTTKVLVRLPLLPEMHIKVIFQLLLSSHIVREAAATLFALNCSPQEELIEIGLISGGRS